MKQIRIGTFETNSSSTHSLVVCTEEEYNKWLKGEILVTIYGNIVTKEQYEKSNQKNILILLMIMILGGNS